MGILDGLNDSVQWSGKQERRMETWSAGKPHLSQCTQHVVEPSKCSRLGGRLQTQARERVGQVGRVHRLASATATAAAAAAAAAETRVCESDTPLDSR